MYKTDHFQQRMGQRNYSDNMLLAILGLGEWNARSDRISINPSDTGSLQKALVLLRREEKRVKKVKNDIERLIKRGKSTIVVEGESLITVYRDK